MVLQVGRPVKITIVGELPTMNEIISMSKRHHMAYSSEKKKFTEIVAWHCKRLPEVVGPVTVVCTWYRKNRRSDPDNVAAGLKFALDGLVLGGVLKNDGWSDIGDITHRFRVDKANPRVEVELVENTGKH